MASAREESFRQAAAALGHSFEGEIRIGGNYVSCIRHGNEVYVSGQIPRVDNQVVVTGAAGNEVGLDDARRAAKICVMRALALLRQSLGSLDRIQGILRMTVYVRSAADFTQQSEVADGASDLLYAIFGSAGVHTRTSVGVLQLPKNATVEIDMLVVASPEAENAADSGVEN